ncbi:MAG: magnesium transporter CorA family protein [Chloroflexi bacterium]|nr:magnesium transporter CorA family protein [Chloroflexota bacterium]
MSGQLYPEKPRRRSVLNSLDWLVGRPLRGGGAQGTQTPVQASLFPETEVVNLQSLSYANTTWVYIERPTAPDIEELARHYPNFHPLNLEDCLSRIQRPKIDEYRDHMFTVFHFPVFDKQHRVTNPSEVDIFIGPDYLITIHCSGDLKPLASLFKDCQLSDDVRAQVMSRGAPYLFYQVLDRLVDYCFPILNRVLENVEKVEDLLFTSPQLQIVHELSMVRRDIISFRRVIHPQIAVIESLERVPRPILKGEQDIYFGDIADHIRRIWDGLEDAKEVIEGLFDTGNWLISHRIQESMRVLTIVLTIMTPLMVLTGFYGMNIPLPLGVEPPGTWWSFGVLLGTMLAITGGLIYFFRRKRWI